jgi:TolB-like protein
LAVTPTAVTTTGALVPLSRRTGDARNSIAVLPFTNAGGLPEKDYFSDWLTEQIAGELSRSGKLQVAARGSARRFKDSRDLRRIGEQLRVDLVLAGGVRFDGDSIGISTRLYDPTTAARSGRANSTGPPRKSRSCVMRLQQLSRDRCTWGTRFPRERAGAGWTQDSGALDFYLQARYLFNSRKPENLRKSVQFYNAALKRDPKFARGYAGVAEDYVVLAANEDQDMQGGGR